LIENSNDWNFRSIENIDRSRSVRKISIDHSVFLIKNFDWKHRLI
jgi:hypothetical protein